MIKIIIMIVLGLIFGGCSTIEPDLVLDMNLSSMIDFYGQKNFFKNVLKK